MLDPLRIMRAMSARNALSPRKVGGQLGGWIRTELANLPPFNVGASEPISRPPGRHTGNQSSAYAPPPGITGIETVSTHPDQSETVVSS